MYRAGASTFLPVFAAYHGFYNLWRPLVIPRIDGALSCNPASCPLLFQVRSGSGRHTKEISACPERNCILGKGHKLAGDGYFASLNPIPLSVDTFVLYCSS